MDKAAGQLRSLQQNASAVLAQVQGLMEKPPLLNSAADLEAHERHMVALTDELASVGVAISVQCALMAESLQTARKLTKSSRFIWKLKTAGTSDPASETFPSTSRQIAFADQLANELREIGVPEVVRDQFGYVTATLPSNLSRGCPRDWFELDQ